jgi:serine/threonine protein kinase
MQYTLFKTIGQGATSKVYLATDSAEKEVAIKIMEPPSAET